MSITADSDENYAIAEINPLRYRGYYYDNETGYYYLQSRYYNPEWCRFISADSFDYLDTSNEFNSNAYIYCWNSPVVFKDTEGNRPEITITQDDIINFLSNTKDKFVTNLIDHIEKLQERYNAFSDKAKFYFRNPDVLINNILSKLLGREVNIQFRFINWIKENVSSSKDNNDSNTAPCSANDNSENNNENNNNIIMAIIQGLVAAIELNWINDILEFFGSSLDILAKKSFEAVKQGSLILITTFNTIIDYFEESFPLDFALSGEAWLLKEGEKWALESGSDLIDAKGIGKGFGGFIAFFKFVLDFESAVTGIFSKTEDIVMASISLVMNVISIFIPFGWGLLVSGLGDIIPLIIALRKNGYIAPVSFKGGIIE